MKNFKNPLWYRMLSKVNRSNDRVFLGRDFTRICKDGRQLRRALKRLTDEGYLSHIGYGLYCKTKRSSLSGKTIPVAPLPELGREAIEKLGLEVGQGHLEKGYAIGKHNQISTGRTLFVTGRFSRKIGYGNQKLDIQPVSTSA